MGTGYADIDNPLFFKENAMMLLGGGKDVSEKLRNYVDGHYKSWFGCLINDLYMQIFNQFNVHQIYYWWIYNI